MTYEQMKVALDQSEARCKALEIKVGRLEKEVDHYRTSFKECALERKWIHEIMTHPTAREREKIMWYASRYETQDGSSRDDGLVHLKCSYVAKKYGLSDDAVGKSFKILKEKGAIKRKVERKYDKDTMTHQKINLVALEDTALQSPRAINFADQSNWGGKREKGNPCGCGCTERVVDRRVTCKQCGCVLEETRKVAGENELDLEPGEEVF